MSIHTSTSHHTWKEHGSRTQQRRNDRQPDKGMPDNTPTINDWDMDYMQADMHNSTHSNAPTVRMHHAAPTCVRVTHVNVHVFSLQRIGDYIGHATSEWRLLRMMEDPRITSTGGCSLHGTLGTGTYSGCISTQDISKVLASYR